MVCFHFFSTYFCCKYTKTLIFLRITMENPYFIVNSRGTIINVSIHLPFISLPIFCCPWSHGLRPKNLWLMWLCHQLLSGFLAKSHLPRISCQPRLSANNEMIPWAVHRSPGLSYGCGKPQLGDPLMKAMRPVISSNGVPYLQMTSVGLHNV